VVLRPADEGCGPVDRWVAGLKAGFGSTGHFAPGGRRTAPDSGKGSEVRPPSRSRVGTGDANHPPQVLGGSASRVEFRRRSRARCSVPKERPCERGLGSVGGERRPDRGPPGWRLTAGCPPRPSEFYGWAVMGPTGVVLRTVWAVHLGLLCGPAPSEGRVVGLCPRRVPLPHTCPCRGGNTPGTNRPASRTVRCGERVSKRSRPCPIAVVRVDFGAGRAGGCRSTPEGVSTVRAVSGRGGVAGGVDGGRMNATRCHNVVDRFPRRTRLVRDGEW
jgi:hypothetical protein